MEPTDKPAEPLASPPDRTAAWTRGLFMLVFVMAFAVSQSVLFLTALVQFLCLLFSGEPNKPLARFGASLSLWMAQTARFLTCATEEKPFPWSDWPRAD